MTTKVTVDAHAGWPVRVTAVTVDTNKTIWEQTVEPGKVQDFYVHSTMNLFIEEVQPVKASGPPG